ncbi:MAG: hypothetical protein HY069_02040 [Chlamydiia bacterium]|nr:hypothetical protein [Chlamydiia bacterium]
MLELSPARKNKVSLYDYNCEQDITNRMLLSDCSVFEIEVLEELLYSPLKLSLKKFARQLTCEEARLLALLNKLLKTGLVTIQGDLVIIDKDMRKYFEFQILRFNPSFQPDVEFIHALLRKVPIHVLPNWYAIPRTSNNIFESIVEKYLLTPHVFQRYLEEIRPSHPIIDAIIDDLFHAPGFTLTSTELITRYNLTRRAFEEMILLLEFHFICCLHYKKEGDHWIELLTPFQEWQQYLQFLNETEAPPITDLSKIERTFPSDFAFVEEMNEVLASISQKPKSTHSFREHVVEKLCLIQLATVKNGKLCPLETAPDWLEMSLENKALHLFRHPFNRLKGAPTQSHVREAEKAIKRVLHGNWVYFDDFVKGVHVTLSDDSVIALKRMGKHWKYHLPTYTEEEKKLIHATVFEWLFEAGMVTIGTCNGRDCFTVTPFGRFLFEE